MVGVSDECLLAPLASGDSEPVALADDRRPARDEDDGRCADLEKGVVPGRDAGLVAADVNRLADPGYRTFDNFRVHPRGALLHPDTRKGITLCAPARRFTAGRGVSPAPARLATARSSGRRLYPKSLLPI